MKKIIIEIRIINEDEEPKYKPKKHTIADKKAVINLIENFGKGYPDIKELYGLVSNIEARRLYSSAKATKKYHLKKFGKW